MSVPPAVNRRLSLVMGSVRAKTSVRLPNPATIVAALGIVASLVTALLNFTPAEAAMVSSLATAIGAIVMCLAQKPVHMLAITAAAGTVVGDMALFGLHLNSTASAAIVGAVGFGVGALLHLIGDPVVATNAPSPVPSPYSPPPPYNPPPGV